jgi:hypothetical protein
MLGQPRFQVGNSTVLEPQVGPGGCETFVERAVVGAELAHALFEGGVLRTWVESDSLAMTLR